MEHNNFVFFWLNQQIKSFFALFLASTPCNPSPCLHDGICEETSQHTFNCDCVGTSYTGKTCHLGLLSIPSFPQFIRNKTSNEFIVKAKPDEILTLKISANKNWIIIKPSQLNFNPQITEGKFTILAKQVGNAELNYQLYGINAVSFNQPTTSKIYVFEQKVKETILDVSVDIFQRSCYKQNIGTNILLKSTCKWSSYGTCGYISFNNLPVSLVGLSFNPTTKLKENGRISSYQNTMNYIENQKLNTNCENCCQDISINKDYVDFYIQNKFFSFIYANQISSLTPSWFNILLTADSSPYKITDLFSALIEGRKEEYFKDCIPDIKMINSDKIYSIYKPNPSVYKYLFFTTTFQPNIQICLLTDSKNMTAITFPKPLNLLQSFTSQTIKMKKVLLSSMVFDQYTDRQYHGTFDVDLIYNFQSFTGEIQLKGLCKSVDVNKVMNWWERYLWWATGV